MHKEYLFFQYRSDRSVKSLGLGNAFLEAIVGFGGMHDKCEKILLSKEFFAWSSTAP